MFKSSKIKSLFLAVFVCGSMSLMAQEQDISDKELGQFADAYTEVQVQNQKSQEKMIAIIKDEGLEVERFNEIQQAEMDPNQESDATEAEKEKHENVIVKFEELQPEIEKKAIASIESAGITLQDYEKIGAKIQADQSLQQRLQAIIVKRQSDKS